MQRRRPGPETDMPATRMSATRPRGDTDMPASRPRSDTDMSASRPWSDTHMPATRPWSDAHMPATRPRGDTATRSAERRRAVGPVLCLHRQHRDGQQ